MSELASPTGIILILILIGVGASFVALLLKYSALLKQIEALENYLHNLEKQADHNSGVLFRVADMADQVRIATAENTASIEAMRREMGHLSDEVRGEVGTSRAIENGPQWRLKGRHRRKDGDTHRRGRGACHISWQETQILASSAPNHILNSVFLQRIS